MITPSDTVANEPVAKSPAEKPVLRLSETERETLYLMMHILKISPYSSRKILLSNLPVPAGCTMVTTKAVALEEYEETSASELLDNADNMMFERLMAETTVLNQNQQSYSVTSIPCLDVNWDKGATEKRQMHYLYQCFHRATLAQADKSVTKSHGQTVIRKLMQSVVTQSYLYLNLSNDSIENSIFSIVEAYGSRDNHTAVLTDFLEQLACRMFEESDHKTVASIYMRQLFDALSKQVSELSIVDVKLHPMLGLISLLTSGPSLAEVFLLCNSPWNFTEGYFNNPTTNYLLVDVLKSVFGRLLSISCLTRSDKPQLEFFTDASRNVDGHQAMESNIGAAIRRLVLEIKNIWHKILKFKHVQNDLLNWIGVALYALKDQSKLWTNAMAMETGNVIMTTDGFSNNLAYVLLLFAKPFAIPRDNKLLKIDVRYAMAEELPLGQSSPPDSNKIHMRKLKDETFISESDSDFKPDMSSFKPNFITEIFFMTHKALEVGYKSCQERFTRLTSDLNTLQRLYQDGRAAAGPNHDAVEHLKQQLEKGMTNFLSMKAVLAQPDYVESMMKLHVATASWLTNIAACSSVEESISSFKEIDSKMLLSESGNPLLSLIPEFVMENISDTIIFIRRFRLEQCVGQTDLAPLMTLILTFMGSVKRVKNPHLRAKFAEVLESLMPHKDKGQMGHTPLMTAFDFGSLLFLNHPHVRQLVPTLLNVFVSIELTGQSVAFEHKFQYRRPMYIVLKYLWHDVKHPHRDVMRQLADDAEKNIDARDAPLFLRFVNLLLNDANYLLDESLRYMKLLKEMQQKRDSVEWQGWSEQQRLNHHSNYQHHGQLARFHNVMAHDTIETLAWLTEGVQTIFCSATLVNRIAEMLNYFLKFLVGSEKRNFKVKDLEEFEFKPADIVHDISRIYCNLSHEQNPMADVFKKAVVTDARSYTNGLLNLASEVLIKTNKATGGLSVSMRDLSVEFDKLSQEVSAADIPEEDIPEEFQCAILSDLMTDPVKLPSGKIVDRKTIARHLLSDQRDPFNQMPMTMEMVEPDPELKARIEEFVKNYQKK